MAQTPLPPNAPNYPPDVALEQLGHAIPGREWTCWIARRTDGVCWGVVFDSLIKHEGERRFDATEALADVNQILHSLHHTAIAAQHYSASAGTN